MSATAPEPDTSLAGALTPRDLAQPVTFKVLADALDNVLSLFTRLRVAARLSAAEARLQALEAMALPHYEGTFELGKSYRQGSLCTRGGSLWLALSDTNDTPGSGATNWRLVVKAGRV